ncbi:hypothetical protein K493DRAFT_374453 [Basidiobolus meristosporus CBS 931.73]|uniref:Uncharacterized protein n=1 Tax=Basidiobolus meristosporus CBS 931.73 TaxID=1314790 RepID=A0A1Y1Y8R9_9FUNG|nr:hypothetical protein K493DRAFT_374453 [Basidiobolus meristosporus CBS 931.73]|eukprot:ORX93964.1 hypothetical protein K493DRAFT_374453 [Basidiobolus meristosporus CBS 931.73]
MSAECHLLIGAGIFSRMSGKPPSASAAHPEPCIRRHPSKSQLGQLVDQIKRHWFPGSTERPLAKQESCGPLVSHCNQLHMQALTQHQPEGAKSCVASDVHQTNESFETCSTPSTENSNMSQFLPDSTLAADWLLRDVPEDGRFEDPSIAPHNGARRFAHTLAALRK